MILESPQGGDLATQSFDVCIAGAGPAGITLALALSAQGRRVLLLEAGGFEISPVSQDFYTGENVGLDYYDPFVSRLRYFGGTSNHWGGRCRPLDAHDFEPRPGLPLSGWPITKADLDPYAEAADAVLDLDPVATVSEGPTRPADPDLRRIGYRHSPVKFNARYRDEIVADPNILLVLNANLVDLRLDDARDRVTGAVVRGYDEGVAPVTVQAETFCICLGGLENARFLLNADSQVPGGIGNGADLVGRYLLRASAFLRRRHPVRGWTDAAVELRCARRGSAPRRAVQLRDACHHCTSALLATRGGPQPHLFHCLQPPACAPGARAGPEL